TLTALTAWNMYLWPPIITNTEEMKVLPPALARLGGGSGAIGAGERMAATTLAILPMVLLYVVGQRWFGQGIARTGLKGWRRGGGGGGGGGGGAGPKPAVLDRRFRVGCGGEGSGRRGGPPPRSSRRGRAGPARATRSGAAW